MLVNILGLIDSKWVYKWCMANTTVACIGNSDVNGNKYNCGNITQIGVTAIISAISVGSQIITYFRVKCSQCKSNVYDMLACKL